MWQHWSSGAILKRKTRGLIKVAIFKQFHHHHYHRIPSAVKQSHPSPELNKVISFHCSYPVCSYFTVTPVPITMNWKLAPSFVNHSHVRSRPYTSSTDFSVGNIFTGQVQQIMQAKAVIPLHSPFLIRNILLMICPY